MGVNAVLPEQVLPGSANVGDTLVVVSVAGGGKQCQLQAPAAGGGIGGSTGSTDNAILTADGTGGSTLQAASWLIPDNYTASPNATINVCALEASGATTNVAVAIVPKGTGSFSLHVPDGTATGGNARGANAVDLQTNRSTASQVASGTSSFVTGQRNTASGTAAVALGFQCTAGSTYAVAAGGYCSATSAYAVALGNFARATNYSAVAIGANSNASGNQAIAIGAGNGSKADAQNGMAIGDRARADRDYIYAYAAGGFTAAEGVGDSQYVRWVLRNKTTDGTTATTLFAGNNDRCLLTSGKVLHATVHVVGAKSDGSAVAVYQRQVAIKNVGGTTSLVGSVNTIGSDTAAGTSLSITADNTNDALDVQVTGIAAETWRWVATVVGVEVAYGT